MNKQVVLDHFGIVSKSLCLYVAVGPYHPINGYVAYMKYRPGLEGPWRSAWGAIYDRVLPVYSPHAIEELGDLEPFYDPMLGSTVPLLPIGAVMRILDPRDIAKRIVSSCRDELECLASELLADLVAHGLPLECIGIAGSLMFGIHVPKHSDIDIVVYGERCVEKALEVLPQVLEPLPKPRAELVIENLSHIHGISAEVASRCLAVPRRGYYRGTEVTVVYTWSTPWTLKHPVRSWTCASMTVYVDPGSLGALMYPGLLEARCGKDVVEILSFESALSIPLFFGGWFRVEGVLQKLSDGRERLVLGCRECPSSIALEDSASPYLQQAII